MPDNRYFLSSLNPERIRVFPEGFTINLNNGYNSERYITTLTIETCILLGMKEITKEEVEMLIIKSNLQYI